MAISLKSSNLIKNLQSSPSSSDDEEQNDKNVNNDKPIPKFYMLPNEKYPHLQRNYLITKLDILAQIHKKEEKKILTERVGWNVLYNFFFQRLFLVSNKNDKVLNLKEVEIRIRKEIGKIRQKKNNDDDDEINKEPYFNLFEKINYNPPMSSIFSHNFIKDSNNYLLGKSEENSQMVQILNAFINFKKKEIEVPKIRNVHSNLQKKEEIEIKKNKLDRLRRKSNIELKKFNIYQNKNESRLLDHVDFHLHKIINKSENNNGPKIVIRKDIIPKGAKKIVKKFVNKYKYEDQIFVEDEINFIQNDQKVYDMEIKSSKMFENEFLDSKRYLFDFQYLKSMLNNEKKATSFNFKNQMDAIFKQIDFTINGVNSIDKKGNEDSD